MVRSIAVLAGGAAAAIPRVEIAPGVFYPTVQLGACTTCSTGEPCCGSNLTASLPVYADALGPDDVLAVDTQLRYNDTEIVAHELAKLNRSREQLWITTKIDPKVYCAVDDPHQTALDMIQDNLRQLNVSYVDLLLLHEPCDRKHGQPSPIDQLAWNAAMYALEQGWARAIGVDKFAIAQLDALQGHTPSVLMGPLSMSDHDEDLLDYCKRKGIHFNAFGIFQGCKFDDPVVQHLASKYALTQGQICGMWTRQRGLTMAVGAGTDPAKIAEHLPQDLDIFAANLTDAEMDSLNRLQETSLEATVLV